MAVKKSPLNLNSNLGPCNVSLSYWTSEFGSHSIDAGNYNWIRLHNLPLHCWNWDSIVEVLRPLGDLIYVQRREDISLENLRALVRLKAPTAFPLDVIVDVGVRSFMVRLQDDDVPTLRSKFIQGPAVITTTHPKVPPPPPTLPDTQPIRSVHQISREVKGKDPIPHVSSLNSYGKIVEHSSDLGLHLGTQEPPSSNVPLLDSLCFC